MTKQTEDNLARAMAQGQAQFDSIAMMVADLQRAIEQDQEGGADETDAPRSRIEEDALGVEVRSPWYTPGDLLPPKPAEYCILLCTGGTACRLVGELNQHGEPETAHLEVQDWFTPWTECRLVPFDVDGENGETVESILLAYASCFYFGG